LIVIVADTPAQLCARRWSPLHARPLRTGKTRQEVNDAGSGEGGSRQLQVGCADFRPGRRFVLRALFEIAPEIKPLFRGDMAEQGRKLMATLGAVVNSLGNLEAILPAASALAQRHVGYGVKAADYVPVGAALLWTLEKGLGERWTPQLAQAWGAAYALLSDYMIGEAYGRSVAAE
jgi:nitric oxide dioxygenase